MSKRYNPDIHHRRSIRLSGYNYAQVGAYFVTICVQHRLCLFGDIISEVLQLSDAGRMIQSTWNEIPHHYSDVDIDAFVVMPNHVHGIIILTTSASVEQSNRNIASISLPDVINRFKIRDYISNNPARWAEDTGKPAR